MFGRGKKDEGGIPGMGSLSRDSYPASPSGIPGSHSSADAGIPGSHAAPSERASVEREAPAGERPALVFAAGSTAAEAPQLGQHRPWEIGPWTIRAFVVLFIAAFAFVFVREEQRRLDDPVQQASRGEITVTSSRSLLREANLERALAAARKQSPGGATVESLRITPTRVDLTVAQEDGAQRRLSVDPGFGVDETDYPASEPEGLAFSKIPTDVPERLIKTARAKLGLQPADLDYVLLNPRKDIIDGSRDDSWGIYYSRPPLKNDATAELDGTDVRLLGTPDKATRAKLRASARQSLASLDRAERQITSAPYASKATREQALASIRRARAQAENALKEAGQ